MSTDNPTFDDTAQALTTKDTLEGTVTVDGTTFPIKVQEATLAELEAIEEEVDDSANEVEVVRRMVDEYLEAPQIDPANVPVGKINQLFLGMRDTWMQGVDMDPDADMPLDKGNR